MAKEMMITFVYDTEMVKSEEDDPATAILYFHPGWVSDQQRTALCGQIIGTCHFLISGFKPPRIFALQSGKFSIRTYGRYILAIGTDRNIADWVLEHRADTLTSLVSFFHHDLVKMAELYQERVNLSAKLYHTFETYLKILMYGGHMFYNIPTIQLPKSASHVFLEAIQLLQCCQQFNNVLGGTILYHNKVVATQLSSELTKKLVLTDPYRIKSPAEIVATDFSLPLGVQLLQVYIPNEDYRQLCEDSAKCRNVSQCVSRNVKKNKPREPMLSAMKRDQSLIFTTVPEEDDRSPPAQERIAEVRDRKSETAALPSGKIEEALAVQVVSPERPKFLNLKVKTTDKYETPFRGSVCSTPMSELNKVVHQNIMSICVDPDKMIEENLSNSTREKASPKIDPEKFKHCMPYIYNGNPYDRKKSCSAWDVRETLKGLESRITMRYYSIGLPNLHDLEPLPKSVAYKTVADPSHPISKRNGVALSRYLYNTYLQEPIFLPLEVEKPKEEFKSLSGTPPARQPSSPSPTLRSPLQSQRQQQVRKSLSLPLKSLSSSEQADILSPRRNCGVQLTPLMSKLSLLAMEEKSSGFSSQVTTPSEYKDVRFTPTQPNYSFLRRRSSSTEESFLDRKGLREAVLFVCGQQDMVMGVLLEAPACNGSAVVSGLFEKCTESLGKLERQLRHCLETYPGGSTQSESGETYSYLCMDPLWDTVRRGGPWGSCELGLLTHLHRDFIDSKNITEIIIRNDDSIIYGHHCGNTEVYYQQAATSTAGLPTPADAMGTVVLKAKRRLERDHAVILL